MYYYIYTTFFTFPSRTESLTDMQYSSQQSCLTIVLAAPALSLDTLDYSDQTSQCNIDTEVGKSFLMYNVEDLCFNVLSPTRRIDSRVYEIEDVASRLNCSTLHVTKFSKTTQNLMARNKVDTLVHTKEVVDEIRHLTNLLNFNRKSLVEHSDRHTWCNINWGDNAPYWNQYYSVVRQFNYPFESKSEEDRMLELLTEEINRLMDNKNNANLSLDELRLEIPMSYLMSIVGDVTDDEERVKDLLLWNGYEIIDDVLVHTLVLDDSSLVSQEDETTTDWDSTDVHSTSYSDASTLVPDYHGKRLRNALDRKVRKLRSMLSADEDIITELDRVVCRLMKLALRSSRGRQRPPPTRWMQCKMLDMLTLSEKAIERRKKHYIDNYQPKAICYGQNEEKSLNMQALEKIKDDNLAAKLLDKYDEIVHPENINKINYLGTDIQELDDFSTFSTNEFFKDNEIYYDRKLSYPVHNDLILNSNLYDALLEVKNDETQLARTKAWVEEDVKTTSYPTLDISGGNISSGDTDRALIAQPTKPKRFNQKRKVICDKNTDELKVQPSKTFRSKNSHDKNKNKHVKSKNSSKTTLTSKVALKKSGCNNFIKKYNYRVSSECRIKKEHQNLQSTASKPIPESLIKLCHPELKERIISEFSDGSSKHNNAVNAVRSTDTIAITKESLLIDIIMHEAQETIALRRTVATDPETELLADEQETFLESVINVTTDESFCNQIRNSLENVHSQSVFVYDINEPSTSKGIRHVGMDVQCGTDAKMQNFPMLSATTSLTRMPKIFTTGIKIGDSLTNLKNNEKQCSDFGTVTNNDDDDNSKVLYPLKSIGIKIKDSFDKICEKFDRSTTTNTETADDIQRMTSPLPCFDSSLYESKTKLLKPITSELKLDSCSEFCSSGISSSRSPLHFLTSPKLVHETEIKTSISKEIGIASRFSPVKLVTSKLCCGGVHIHSYKDRQETEDIVYQGEWQRQRPKLLPRKSDLSQFLSNKLYEKRITKKKAISKEKLSYKKPLKLKSNEIKVDIKAPVFLKNSSSKYKENLLGKSSSKMKETKMNLRQPVYSAKNTQFNKLKQETLTRLQKRHKLDIDKVQVKITRSNKNLSKVKSKVKMNVVPLKNMHTVEKKRPLSDLKKDDKGPQSIRKTYLPLYLKQNLGKPLVKNNIYLNRSIDTVKNKDKVLRNIPVLGKSKTDEIKTELLNYRNKPRLNVNYAVFRNEIENKKSNSEGETTKGRPVTKESNAKKRTSSLLPNYSGIRNDIDLKKSNIAEQSTKNIDGMPKLTKKKIHSPVSQQSSECSSPDSIATAVRVKSSQEKTVSSRRHSTSSDKSNLGKANSNDKNTAPTRNKKFTKLCKECSNKDIEDKENVSQNTYNNKCSVNDSTNAMFSGISKNIFIAKLQKENLPSNSPNTNKPPNKSSMKIPTSECSDENKKFNVYSASKKNSFKSDGNSLIEKEKILHCDSDENPVLVVEPYFIVSEDSEKEVNSESVNDNVNALAKLEEQSKWENNSSGNIVEGVNSIVLAMKQLVEERLNFINSSCSSSDPIDSETIILRRNSNRSSSRNESVSSPTSFKTILENEDIVNVMLETSIEDALNRTFDTTLDESILSLSDSTRLTMADMDMLSFKSFGTMNEEIIEQNPVAVQDIFERKNLHTISDAIPGVIAIQAFSGYSMDAEPVIGDQADYVNRIDSETGSGALNVSRRTNSEELFVSGRSSESYQTCLVEDDSVVPNWLFHIISRQESIEEEEQPEPMYLMPVEMPMPFEDPVVFDLNGNAVEANMAAGAGDGRGIHSDHSQDSSGQGTSLSSTDMSTGQPSEAVLVDPSAYSGQYSVLRDSVGGSPMVVGIPIDMSTAFATIQQNGAPPTASQEQRVSRRRRHHSVAASDMDADVSSIDTDADVPDSSDN